MVNKKKTAVRGLCCAVMCTATVSLSTPATHASGPPGGQALKERYHAVQHGGIARAANSSITCRKPVGNAAPCASVQQGEAGTNSDYEMFYSDIDRDPNTYNSTRAEVRMPEGSRVSYARLYWGGNLRVGEQKPPKDNGRVLIAEPGGSYKAVLADTVVRHRVATARTPSRPPRTSRSWSGQRPGQYTVAQVNVAMGQLRGRRVGRLDAGGGVREHQAAAAAPGRLGRLRRPRNDLEGRSPSRAGMNFPAERERLGRRGRTMTATADRQRSPSPSPPQRAGTPLSNPANPATTVQLHDHRTREARCPDAFPAHPNTLGYDSDVFDAEQALRPGGDRLPFRFASGETTTCRRALRAVDARR